VTDVLARIAARKREEVLALPRLDPSTLPRASRSFEAAIAAPGLSLIAEIKQRSPSQPHRPEGACAFDPSRLASVYDASARAISVLTDGPGFGGDPTHLRDAAAASRRPILCKDFVVDPERQIPFARAHGADAILLMAQLLSSAEIERALGLSRALGMSCLVETHDDEQLDRVLAETSAPIVGVNARDLRTLAIDLDRPRRMASRARATGRLVVAESGLARREDLRAIEGEVDAILVGTALSMSPDPRAALAELGFSPRARVPAIKLCGLRTASHVAQADALGADAIGLNFVAGARRELPELEAARLGALPLRARRVGVFTLEDAARIPRAAELARLDVVQLHGRSGRPFDHGAVAPIAETARRSGLALWLALEVSDARSVREGLAIAESLGARVVLDGARSGSGRTLDPTHLRGLLLPHDVVLAGGLTPTNVRAAAAIFEPAMVDVATGIEEHGAPTRAAMARFLEAVREGRTSPLDEGRA
jgi:indole-3-glycerol phosphate synthase/phosphoribosylanthranilate isomerase